MTTAGILTIGDELLNGEVQESNGKYLHDELLERNVSVKFRAVIPDSPGDIVAQLRLHQHLDVIFVTGGIGPTHDDRTRQAVALAFDRPLEPHEGALETLREYYGEEFNESRTSMINLPRGSEVHLLEDVPALAFSVKNVVVFPGIPRLLEPLFEQVADRYEGEPVQREKLEFRAREGDLAEDLQNLQSQFPGIEVGSYPELTGTVTVILRGNDAEQLNQARETLEEMVDL